VNASAPVTVTVTGAAGQIGYALLPRIASGNMLGEDTLLELRLLEVPQAMQALEGVVMEIEDSAFPLVAGVEITDDPNVAFDGVDIALLVGSRPRTKGMERSELLEANGAIFTVQGKALSDNAADDVKVLVVGNPANTNCLIAMSNAPDIPRERFTSMMRLDHNRAKAQLAKKAGAHVRDVQRMTIWGNHSATQFPDLAHATVAGAPALTRVPQAWYRDEFIPTVQQRGAAIIKARGASSAASAASAAIDHVRDWALGTTGDDWVSMGVASDGSYEIPEGVVFSYPVRCTRGEYRIVQGLSIDEFARGKLEATDAELREERAGVADLL